MKMAELQAKYPKYKVIFDPDPDCPKCHGAGEFETPGAAVRWHPCLCVCVDHSVSAHAIRVLGMVSRLVLETEGYDD